jgi:hypothetical protein
VFRREVANAEREGVVSSKTLGAIAVVTAIFGVLAVVAVVSLSSANGRVKALEDEINAVDANVSEMDARPGAVVDQIIEGISDIRSRAEEGQEVDFAELMGLFDRMKPIWLRLSSSQKHKLRESFNALFQHTDLFDQFGHSGYD